MIHATKIPWETKNKKDHYGPDDTYREAARWLAGCKTVADWGGAKGYFKRFLPESVDYTIVDGTPQVSIVNNQIIVADLAKYHAPSEGILLRHVLEMTHDWKAVLENAISAFTKRMVVVTFTPDASQTHVATHHLSWPVYHFNHRRDLRSRMEPYLVKTHYLTTRLGAKSWPEVAYHLEKP